ncbi:MAG: TolC family protein [Myxococcales bacterium]|nr:TolC family protein [Myxococcales bacterium]
MRLLLAGILLCSSPSFALQPLEAFVSSALQRNPDALEAKANLDQQRAQSDLALGRVLPGISARASYTRNQYASVVTLTATDSAGKPQTQTFTIVPIEQWDGSATLTVPLIDVAGWSRARAASTGANAANEQLVSTRLFVESQVVQDYYQLVANLALVAASKQALDVSRENLRLAQTRYEAGVGQALDVDRAKAEVELQTQQVAVAELQVSLGAQALESASDVKPEVSETVKLGDDLRAEPPLPSFESDLEKLPAVSAAIETTRAADQQASAQRFTLLPTIAGTFTARGTNAPGFGRQYTWQAVIAATWALDFTTRANIELQDSLLDAARARELRARLAARDAIHRQWETVSANIARSRSARAGQTAAAHAVQQAHDRYQAGTITQLDLLQAQRDAFTADVSRIQADADLVNARAQLRIAAGQSLVKEGMQ